MDPHSASPRRALVRLAVPTAVVALLVLGLAGPASAHVTVTPSSTAAGASVVVAFGFSHGCGESPTTAVTVQIPAGVDSVTPAPRPDWQVEQEVVGERVASVTYRADTPVPDGQREVLELALQLPDAAGEALAFPTIQTCAEGESAWIEVPEAGQDDDDLELPAPSFVLTASGGDGDQPASVSQALTEAANAPAGKSKADSDDAPLLALGALGVGVLGVMLGAAALTRHRRRT